MKDVHRQAGDGSAMMLRVTWLEPPAGLLAFPLSHPYVELVYTPLVGAAAVLFLRRIALLAGEGDSVELDAVVAASELGLRSNADGGLGRNSPFMKAVQRLERLGLTRWLGSRQLGVLRRAPVLADRYVARLPETVRSVHRRYLARTDVENG